MIAKGKCSHMITQLSNSEIQNLIRDLITLNGTLVSISISIFIFILPRLEANYANFERDLSNRNFPDLESFRDASAQLTRLDRPFKFNILLLYLLPFIVGGQVLFYYLYSNEIPNVTILQIYIVTFLLTAWVIVFNLVRGVRL